MSVLITIDSWEANSSILVWEVDWTPCLVHWFSACMHLWSRMARPKSLDRTKVSWIWVMWLKQCHKPPMTGNGVTKIVPSRSYYPMYGRYMGHHHSPLWEFLSTNTGIILIIIPISSFHAKFTNHYNEMKALIRHCRTAAAGCANDGGKPSKGPSDGGAMESREGHSPKMLSPFPSWQFEWQKVMKDPGMVMILHWIQCI